MQSRTSLFNRADWSSDWERFAPIPALYAVLLAAMMLLTIGNCASDYCLVYSMESVIRGLALLQLGYAIVTVQCLFGYLFDSRLCNAIHALPQTRGSRFRTHVLTGILFALVPLLLVALLIATVLAPGQPALAPVWLGTACAQYLFFFGIALLAALFAGNRAGCAIIYAIGILLPLLLPWVVGDILQPLFYGVTFSTDSYVIWPLWIFCNSEYLNVEYQYTNGNYADPVPVSVEPNLQTLAILGVCAVFGMVLIALAGVAYRRRSLENSGELLAIKWLHPVFLVLFTVIFAAAAQVAASLLDGSGAGYEYLFMGLIVGFYVGLMLLKRRVNVFRLKTVPAVMGICAAFLTVLLLTGADAAGIICDIPEESEIKSAVITPYSTENGQGVTADNTADIQSILTIHRQQVEIWKQWREENNSLFDLMARTHAKNLDGETNYDTLRLGLEYVTEGGQVITRDYCMNADSPSGQIAKGFLTRPENFLGVSDKSALRMLQVGRVEVYHYTENDAGNSGTVDDVQGLLEAIYDDCLAGKILPYSYVSAQDTVLYSVYMEKLNTWISIYDNDTETEAFLQQHTIPIPENFYEEDNNIAG